MVFELMRSDSLKDSLALPRSSECRRGGSWVPLSSLFQIIKDRILKGVAAGIEKLPEWARPLGLQLPVGNSI